MTINCEHSKASTRLFICELIRGDYIGRRHVLVEFNRNCAQRSGNEDFVELAHDRGSLHHTKLFIVLEAVQRSVDN